MPRTTAIASVLVFLLVLVTGLVPVWLFLTVLLEFFAVGSSTAPALETTVVRDTITWTLIVMVGATLPGFPAGVLLGRLLSSRWGGVAAASSVLSLCLPGYAIFWFWWQGFGPDGAAGSWFLTRGLSVELREGLLLLSLIAWSWPLVAWPVALATIRRTSHADHAALDGLGAASRLWLRLRACRLQLLMGMLLVGFMVSTATISFDLAQVRTFGFELRAFDALGYQASSLVRFAFPVILLSLVGAAVCIVLFLRISARRSVVDARGEVRQVGVGALFLFSTPALLMVLVPILSAGMASGDLDLTVFSRLHGAASLRSVTNALFTAILCAGLGAGMFILLGFGGSRLRIIACLLSWFWIASSLLPGTIIAAAVTRIFNGPLLGPVFYDTGWALAFAHFAAAGGIAVLIALLVSLMDTRTMTMVRALDAFRIESCRPQLLVVLVIGFLSTLLFTLGDLILGARLAPPGMEGIGGSLLNAMHYQRPDTVVVVLGALVGLAVVLAGVCGLLLPRRVQGTFGMLILISLVTVIPFSGCDSEHGAPLRPADSGTSVPCELVVGAPGRAPGLFETPRGLALDPAGHVFYVVDKTARIQRFGFDGRFQHLWPMPESQVGKPVGLSVAPDGRIYVADTHYHRIIVFDPEGEELQRFGSFGTGPGEFVYPTDIAFGDDGTIFIAEYGTNDRIQVFSSDGTWLRTIGRSGRGDGGLARPQSIALSNDGTELFVADSCNHRISVFGTDGTWRRHLGSAGHDPGEFNYPYGLQVLDDGSLLVSEYGGDRIQVVAPDDGRSLGSWGGTGFIKGRVHMPWGVGAADGRLFVLDSGNSRVQIGDWAPESSVNPTVDGSFID